MKIKIQTMVLAICALLLSLSATSAFAQLSTSYRIYTPKFITFEDIARSTNYVTETNCCPVTTNIVYSTNCVTVDDCTVTTNFFPTTNCFVPPNCIVTTNVILSPTTNFPPVALTNYFGLIWTNMSVMDGVNYSNNPSGFGFGVVSSNNVAFPLDDTQLSGFAARRGHTMLLKSAFLTAAWIDGLALEIQGYSGNRLIFDKIVFLSNTEPTLIKFPQQRVTKVLFVTPGFNPGQEAFVLDNLYLFSF
jgi:hypothetical protein